jgi:hypothetical protein
MELHQSHEIDKIVLIFDSRQADCSELIKNKLGLFLLLLNVFG